MKVLITARQMVSYHQTVEMSKSELKEWQDALAQARDGDESGLADLADRWLDKRDCDDAGEMEEVEFEVVQAANK